MAKNKWVTGVVTGLLAGSRGAHLVVNRHFRNRQVFSAIARQMKVRTATIDQARRACGKMWICHRIYGTAAYLLYPHEWCNFYGICKLQYSFMNPIGVWWISLSKFIVFWSFRRDWRESGNLSCEI